jgi:hypothetical protein
MIFINMIRLKSLLHESKQVGDIYHFTPLSNVAAMLKTQYMIPNDERQISTTRWADMSTSGFQDMKSKPVARFMFDGNKLSTKYQILNKHKTQNSKQFKYRYFQQRCKKHILKKLLTCIDM